MEVVGAEGTVALGALPLAGVVAHLEALVAEDVEALGEHRLLVPHVAAGAAQLGLAKGKKQNAQCQRELPERIHLLPSMPHHNVINEWAVL